jgi:hypothetical protein
MPKTMPPKTAPIKVQVTREPAWPGVRFRSLEMAESMKPRISRSKPSMA